MSTRPILLTHAEMAELFRTTPESGYVQRHRGIEPWSLGFKLGRRTLYPLDAVQAWIDAQALGGDAA